MHCEFVNLWSIEVLTHLEIAKLSLNPTVHGVPEKFTSYGLRYISIVKKASKLMLILLDRLIPPGRFVCRMLVVNFLKITFIFFGSVTLALHISVTINCSGAVLYLKRAGGFPLSNNINISFVLFLTLEKYRKH